MWNVDKNIKIPGLVGLPNLGNTCYMNAALQALLNCQAFNNYFLNFLTLIKLQNKADLSINLYNLIVGIWENDKPNSYVTPQSILRVMRQYFPQFRGYNQCDSQEFLRCFMDLLHNEMKEKIIFMNKNEKLYNQFLNLNINDGGNSETSSFDYETCDSGNVSDITRDYKNFGMVSDIARDYKNIYSQTIPGIKYNDEISITSGNLRTNKMDSSLYKNTKFNSKIVNKKTYLYHEYSKIPHKSRGKKKNKTRKGKEKLSIDKLLLNSSNVENDIDKESLAFSFNDSYKTDSSSASPYSTLNDFRLSNVKSPSPIVSSKLQKPNQISPKMSNFDHKSLVSDIFDGKIISKVECLTCHTISKTIEIFQDLSLSIPTPTQLINLKESNTPNRSSNLHLHEIGQQSSPSLTHRYVSKYTLDNSINDMPTELSDNSKSLSFDVNANLNFHKKETDLKAKELRNHPNNTCSPTDESLSMQLSSKLANLLKVQSSLSDAINITKFSSFLSSPYTLSNLITWLYDWIKKFLPIGIPVTLQNCLSAFFACDELNGDNMYSCENCKKLRNGMKESRIIKLPEILCIHFKRFRHDVSSSSKVSTKIEFPLEELDMRPYLDKSCKDEIRTYNLLAIISHHGNSLASGHYTAYALNYYDGHWYEYDDETVTQMKEFQIEKVEPYVLFYGKNQDSIASKRLEALRLQQEYNPEFNTNCHLPFYISKQWLNKFNHTAEPGPIDQSDFVCIHKAVKPNRFNIIDDVCQDIGIHTWMYLYKNFDGDGPINMLQSCKICEEEQLVTEEKRKREYSFYTEYMKLQYTTDFRDDKSYLINLKWFKNWEDFIKGHEEDPPGAIDNKPLTAMINKEKTSNNNVPICYIGEGLWHYLLNEYGGGPDIPANSNQSFL